MIISWNNLDYASVTDISEAIYGIVKNGEFTSEDLRTRGIYLPSGVLRKMRGDGYIVKVGKSRSGNNTRYVWRLTERALKRIPPDC